ncbi:gamma-D-glutamyl-L-diamino acid endopeptidase 1 [Thermoclostridium stercorarium subsp. stercorarium DSM 8532]|uniref:Gamma-D-glutamyl-L-diamino acid endopeptidase 1 n=3 Tax=Thermoclostridium stercorarium TaxID=1510 RepID=L7VK37_THES1|nr:M14 family metallopeptidase [Thermoclostridium stercorarium]AGC68495.1 gamma-D-glutamyl-L-diamino acid endopeptidase 1 [Thermoclostridium stercorarium subsp. stercorarium DSM 8532]AGI39513.1 LysM domain-containing protein [Thermoclostridium stercorarium subsp. stercorarium DSM 8532]ANW98855.1 peptidase M14 [Thermoclostridium stercorarium subsp. thermolacticum DSM 2910]ANX01380.1 peptidase M14 [Thermoclostridium stercorarium subsp. leptospartum DSM 9219]UZQ84481.1 M14 family metallopeptidase
METLRPGSRGPYVKLVQSLLARIGYNPGPVDGIYGINTQRAVTAFQRNNGLTPDGIVGPVTWNYFQSFLRGYDTYTIRPGDTLYRIAQRYYTTVNAILTANPGINPLYLRVGQIITVPYGIEVVFTDIDYTYEILEMDIEGLEARYPFIETGIIGKSVLGKNLYYIRLGTGPVEVHYNGAHHALEWITAPLLMKFAENFCRAYASGYSIRGYNVREIWNRSSIYIVPMVNPDGVDLVLEGLKPDNPYYEQLLQWNRTGLPFSQVWQANIRGTDLNRNYPASWQDAKAQEEAFGIFGPGPTRYGGPSPLSEPETQAMVNFTRQHNFKLVIAYHSQGEVIYWLYKNMQIPRAREIGEIFARASGYTLSETPYEAAYAGYKDWFIEEFRRPGYTIEVGLGRNPLPISQFNSIYSNNEEIMLLAPII